MSNIYDRLVNYEAIIDRLTEEAEDEYQLADMVKAELYAYEEFVEREKPYKICMWDFGNIENEEDSVIKIGAIYRTPEDWDCEVYQEIYPISNYDGEEYTVEYKVINK